MKSKVVQRLLRALITLLGAGIGAGLTLLGLQLYSLANPLVPVPVRWLVVAYSAASVLGGLVFFLLSRMIIEKCADWGNRMEQRMDTMPMSQMLSSLTGLICGLIIAFLVSQILNFIGASIFTTAFSAILYLVLGATGYSVGRRREQDFGSMLGRVSGIKERRYTRKHPATRDASALSKILDTSVIIDGRIFDVCKTGFVEGELVIPQFVLDELRHIADSSDPLRRNRGRRGLDILQKLQTELKLPVRVDESDFDDTDEVDVKLLRLARQTGGVVVTGDFNLNKVAAVTGVQVLNLNDLAGALKPVVLPGEEMTVQIVKEGKEPGQGVAYLDDGTMIVVEGGRRHVNETVDVTVTTVLQTSAGRMIFTRLKTPDLPPRTAGVAVPT